MRNIIIIALLLLASAGTSAQTALPPGVTPPDYDNDVLAYDSASGKTFKLESQKASYGVSSKAYRGNSVQRTVEGDRSPVRIGRGVRLFMKWDRPSNPSSAVILGVFEARKGRRSATMQSTKTGFLSFGSETSGGQERRVAVEFRKMEKGMVEIVITGTLPAGEYFLGGERAAEMACFGVD